MSNETEIKLSSSHSGRIVLHLICITKKPKMFISCIKGIVREFTFNP